jgi:hypothetical protein
LAQQVFPSEELKKKFVTALKEAVASVSDKLTWGGSELNIQGKIVSALLGVLEDNTKEQPLAAVIGAYTTLLKLWKERLGTLEDKRQPVLILDEVNVLMTWSDEYVKERQELLRFFIAISKQECSSHVILATSEYAVEDWLKRGEGASVTTAAYRLGSRGLHLASFSILQPQCWQVYIRGGSSGACSVVL